MTDWSNDDELERLLGQAISRFDPVPQDVVDRAKAIMPPEREIDLVFDSWSDERELATVRSTATDADRFLSFQTDSLQLDIEMQPHGTEIHVVGQLSTEEELIMSVEANGVANDVPLDPQGRFVVDATGDEVRFRLQGRDGPRLVTEWIHL